MFAVNVSTSPSESFECRFKYISSQLVELLSREGIHTKAYVPGLPYFSKLDDVRKSAAIEIIESYYLLCMEHLSESQALRDSKRFTWRALMKMGMAPPSDLFERITDGDIIEVYGINNVQLFRNLEFFERCSYSLEELFCNEWYRLFHREEAATAHILNRVIEVFDKKHPQGLHFGCGSHLVVEQMSEERWAHYVEIKTMAPLLQHRQVVAVLCIEEGTRVHLT